MQGTKVLKLQWQQNAILMCHRDSPGGKESSCLPIVTQWSDWGRPSCASKPSLDFNSIRENADLVWPVRRDELVHLWCVLGIQLDLTPSVMREGVVSTILLFSWSSDTGDSTEPPGGDLSVSPASKTLPGLIFFAAVGTESAYGHGGRVVTGVQVSEHLQMWHHKKGIVPISQVAQLDPCARAPGRAPIN